MSTSRRKERFLEELLRGISPLGFADVGSGGPLKMPWTLLPAARISKFDFDAAPDARSDLGVCISNRHGEASLNIARDPRSSSLHQPSEDFMSWFADDGMRIERRIDVKLETLDRIFAGRESEIDLIDINAEGHDLMVLEGAVKILRDGLVKLLKVEFELAEVWIGQRYFGDIDGFLRGQGYVLADVQIDYRRPATVRSVAVRGEPIWGKAIYVPNAGRWAAHEKLVERPRFARDLVAGAAACVLFDLPGRALALAETLSDEERPAIMATPRPAIDDLYRYSLIDSISTSLRNGVADAWSMARAALGG